MADADLGDVTIHYEETGGGPLAYVFCHGGGGTDQVFVEHFPFWQEHFPRVVTWDNRGMGLEIFQEAGHGVYRHKRDEFRALVLEFCRDHGILPPE